MTLDEIKNSISNYQRGSFVKLTYISKGEIKTVVSRLGCNYTHLNSYTPPTIIRKDYAKPIDNDLIIYKNNTSEQFYISHQPLDSDSNYKRIKIENVISIG